MKIPAIRIIDTSGALLTEVDTYTSLYFKRSWQGVGDFQFVLPADAQGLGDIGLGHYIMLDNDGHRAGIIRSLEYTEDNRGPVLSVKGVTLNGLTAQRITVPKMKDVNANPDSGEPEETDPNGGYDNVPELTKENPNPIPVPAETILKTYASRHLAQPEDPTRRIPMTVDADFGRGMKTVWMSRYERLDTVLQKAAEYCDMGWEIYLDKDGGLHFDVIPGSDHSVSQEENSPVLFSLDFESIKSLNHLQDLSGYLNLGYAAGMGEGYDRTVLKVTNEQTEPTAFTRFETFLDCGDLAITVSDTAMSLVDEGKHQLKEFEKQESLSAVVAPESSFVYGVDWALGDLVTIQSRIGGVSLDARIAEITERYESTQMGIDVTFGTAPLHLGRVIQSLKNIPR